MRISVHLYGVLRDRLPPAAKGRTTLELPDVATVGDLLATLGIERRVIVSINGRAHIPTKHILQDGDQVMIYTPAGGG
jgi:sulfur carrier protein ThiS